MDKKDYKNILSNYMAERLEGQPKKELKLKYYTIFEELDNEQFEDLMFHDFLLDWHPEIIKSNIGNGADTKITALIIALMQNAWNARANFHAFVNLNNQNDLKKTIDVCLN